MLLSFTNLVEAHVLYVIRRVHKIKMAKVREAMTALREECESQHPLAEIDLYTEGKNIIYTEPKSIIAKYETFVNMSAGKQIEMTEAIRIYLKRIERDESKIARFYPFIGEPLIAGPAISEQPKVVSVDPFVSFGRPVVVGSNIRSEILAERWLGGDSIENLASDYKLEKSTVEAALKYESAHRPSNIAA